MQMCLARRDGSLGVWRAERTRLARRSALSLISNRGPYKVQAVRAWRGPCDSVWKTTRELALQHRKQT